MEISKIIASAEAENDGEMYTTTLKVHQHEMIADELAEFGGKDLGPAPGDYLCMAIASCQAITLRMYVNRKKWQVDKIRVAVKLVKADQMPSGLNTFFCEISTTGAIDPEQHKRLLEISKACPIHRLLSKPSELVTTML